MDEQGDEAREGANEPKGDDVDDGSASIGGGCCDEVEAMGGETTAGVPPPRTVGSRRQGLDTLRLAVEGVAAADADSGGWWWWALMPPEMRTWPWNRIR
jgi:hypothetical protein